MKKLKLKYYRWQYQRAHKDMRKMNQAGKKPTPRSSDKYTRLQNRAEKYGLKWWALRPTPTMGGEPVGLDLTLLPLSIDEVRAAMPKSPKYTDEEKVRLGLIVLEDKSVKIGVVNWTSPEGNHHQLLTRDGKLDIRSETVPTDPEEQETWAAYSPARRAWLEGVRGPADADS